MSFVQDPIIDDGIPNSAGEHIRYRLTGGLPSIMRAVLGPGPRLLSLLPNSTAGKSLERSFWWSCDKYLV